MHSTFARLTKKLVDRGRFTVTELCDPDLADCSERHFYNWLNGDAHLPDYKVERLARYFTHHGETQPSSAFYEMEWVLVRRLLGKANGSTKDDFAAGVKALVGADENFEQMSRADMRPCLDELRSVLANLEAEWELLPE